MISEKLKNKIKKILAIARRGGTEAEMNLAMHKVHELLAQHNLSMEEVDVQELKECAEFQKFEKVGNEKRWISIIYGSIAKLYFCEAHGRASINAKSKRVYQYILVGRPSNIAVAKTIAEFVLQELDKLVKALNGNAYIRNSFRIGFADRIFERCEWMVLEALKAKEGDANSKALIIHPLYAETQKENEEVANKNFNMKQRKPDAFTLDRTSYMLGAEAGNKVNLQNNLIKE